MRNVQDVTHNGADVVVTVNRSPGKFTVSMPDMLFKQIQDENVKQLQRFRGTVQSKIDQVVAKEEAHIGKDWNLLHQMAHDACAICHSCGGEYPYDQALLPLNGRTQVHYGASCAAGPWFYNSWGKQNVHFCCK